MYISTTEGLQEFCSAARQFSAVAVDTEFLRERSYYPKLCLVQIATPEDLALIDPLAIQDMSALRALLSDTAVMKVFHACSQDMEVLYHALGVLPTPIFDTQVAAAFLGERMQISYHGLVQTFCGVTLPKSESLTDWSRRPLTERQLSYAADDVRYLIRAYEDIQQRLHAMGRTRWVQDELASLGELSHYVCDDRLAYRRVKRATSLTRRQLAVLRELASWREKRAAQRDIPRKWVLSDEALLALVKRVPKEGSDVRSVRGTEQLSDRDVAMVLDSIQKGLGCPKDRLPSMGHPHHALYPEAESICDLMYALLRLVSARSGVATALIASRDELSDYIEHPERSRLREGWRFELVGSLLDDLLRGNIGLTVKQGTVEIL